MFSNVFKCLTLSNDRIHVIIEKKKCKHVIKNERRARIRIRCPDTDKTSFVTRNRTTR